MSPSQNQAAFPVLVPWLHSSSLYAICYHLETFHCTHFWGVFPAFNSPFSRGTGSRTILGLVFAWPYDNISEDKESWGQYLGSTREPGPFPLLSPHSPPEPSCKRYWREYSRLLLLTHPLWTGFTPSQSSLHLLSICPHREHVLELTFHYSSRSTILDA